MGKPKTIKRHAPCPKGELAARETVVLRLLGSWDAPSRGEFYMVNSQLDMPTLRALARRGLAEVQVELVAPRKVTAEQNAFMRALTPIGEPRLPKVLHSVRITMAGHQALDNEYLRGGSAAIADSLVAGGCTFCNRMVRPGPALSSAVVVMQPAPGCHGMVVRACEACTRDLARDLTRALQQLKAIR